MKMLAAAIVAATLLAGCSTTGSKPAMANPTATKAPKVPLASLVPADYRQKVIEYSKLTLKDPYSIKSAGITAPRGVFVGLINGGTVPGVCVQMNGKNSFGAYIGVQATVFGFKNGEVFYAAPPVFGDCDKAVYAPFPELENIT